jgi:hypothetical protein
VWLATVAGAAWLAFRTVRLSLVHWLAIGASAVVAIGCILVADPAVLDSAREMVGTNLSETQGDQSTWNWRVQGYIEATDRVLASGAIDKLVGPPAGWAAITDASFASIHIHSRYVDTLAYYGFVGASILLVWLVVLIKRSGCGGHDASRMQAASRSYAAFLQAILFSELVYLGPYFGGMLQGAVLGLLWIAATQRAPRQKLRCLGSSFISGRCTPDSRVLVSHS